MLNENSLSTTAEKNWFGGVFFAVLLGLYFSDSTILFGVSCYASYSRMPRNFPNEAQEGEPSYCTPLKSPPEGGNCLSPHSSRIGTLFL